MNIFKRISNTLKTEKRNNIEEISININPVKGKLFTDYFNGTAYNSVNNASILRGINAISNSIASARIFEYNIINNEKIRVNSQIDYLLNISPNNFMTAFQLKKQIIENVFYTGNALVKIERDNNNNILSLNLLNSTHLSCRYDYINNTATYYYSGQILDMSDYLLIFINSDKNYNGFFGESILNFGQSTLKKVGYVTEYQNNFFNGGSLSGILSPKGPQRVMPEHQAKAAKEKFLTASMDKGIVVLDADMEFSKISTNAKDSMLLEMNEFNIEEIARILNIPPSFLFSDGKEITESDYISYYSQTLQPIFDTIENQIITKFFFRKEQMKGKIVEFDIESVMKSDKTTLASYYSQLFQLGVLSPNDIARKLNLSITSEDGSNNRYVLQNVQKLSSNLNDIKAKEAGLINE